MNTLPILEPLPTGPGAREQVLRTYFPDMNFDKPGVGWAEFQRVRALDTASENLVGIARILSQLRPDTPALAATGVPVHVLYGDQDEIWPPAGTPRRPRTWVRARALFAGRAQCPAAVPAGMGAPGELVLGGRGVGGARLVPVRCVPLSQKLAL